MGMGLVESDDDVDKIFEEACCIMMPKQLRQFFAWFLMADSTPSSCKIWEKFKFNFCEGFRDNHETRALHDTNEVLKKENLSCEDFGLPKPSDIETEIIIHDANVIKKINNDIFRVMIDPLHEDQFYILII